MKQAKSFRTGQHIGAAIITVLGFGCATIAGLDEDFEHAPECDSILPPAKPSVKNAGDSIDFSSAIRTVDLDEEDEGPRFGFDLDKKCSCTIDGPSCTLPSYIDADKATCDDARGLDNGMGIALAKINEFAAGTVSSTVVNEGATQGLWTLIISVRGYSGTANDDHVKVALYETPGITSPAWNGTDVWPVTNTTVGPSGSADDPVNFDDYAYVSNGVLVAHIPKTRIYFRASTLSLPVDLVDVIVSAKIVDASAGNWRLTDGILAAKWTHSALFQSLSAFRYSTELMKKFCRDDILYLQVKTKFCAETDILDNASANGSTECNAISFGMRFDTESVRLGPVTDPLPPPDPICDINFDPITDTCVKIP